MSDEARDISIVVKATQAIRQLTNVGVALDTLGKATGSSDAQLRKLDRQLDVAQAVARRAAKTLAELKVELRLMSKEATAAGNTIKALETRLATSQRTNARLKQQVADLTRANKMLTDTNNKLSASYDKLAVAAATGTSKATRGVKSLERAMNDLDENFQQNALRYALYDVARSFSVLRDAGVAALSALGTAGIEFDRNFANVLRTSQVSNVDLFSNSPLVTGGIITAAEQSQMAIQALQRAFIDLQSSIPVTGEELSRIGTLAAQMGIAASEVANFTEVTAKFSAASGITADEAATALARVSQLLASDVQGDYERLASAILKTGVNAIATEQQIVRGTTQIAAIGKVAGLSATDIVALSSAMSSLGMSPELQRSIVTSSFTKILNAVRGSTEEAQKFGVILGQTGQQFQEAFENDGYDTYRKLLATIAASPNAISILQNLGLASQRLTPNLLKLGQAYELLGETRADTEQGWNEDMELQRQYQIIMDATASKLQVLGQAWEGLLIIMGSGGVDLLGDLAGGLTNLIKGMQDFAASPIGKIISTIVIGVGLLATGIFAVTTAITLAGAAFLGFDFVMKQLSATVATGTISMGGYTFAVNTATVGTTRAQVAALALGNTIKALLSPISAVIAAFTVMTLALQNETGMTAFERSSAGLSNSIETLMGELSGEIDTHDWLGTVRSFETIFDGIDASMAGFNRGLGGFAGTVWGSIALLDVELAKLASKDAPAANAALQELKASWVASGKSSESFAATMPDTINALSLVTGQTAATTEELDAYIQGMEAAATEEEKAAYRLSAMASAMGLFTGEMTTAEDAVTGFMDSFSSGAGEFFNIGDMLAQAFGTDEGQGGGIAVFQQQLDDQLVAANTWAEGLASLIHQGAGSVAAAFAAEGPAASAAIAEALALSPDGLAKLEQSMADAAFFASAEYAAAFAADNSILADVYKKALAIDPATALEALHETREALTSSGGILDAATIAKLEGDYDIKLDLSLVPTVDPADVEQLGNLLKNAVVEPVKVPVSFTNPALPDGDFTKIVDAWQVTLDGKSVTIPVDPKTEEGEALITEWALNEAREPVQIGTNAKTEQAQETLRLFRQAQENTTLWINAQIRSIGGAPTLGGDAAVPRRDGGIMGKVPGFATGSLRGPLRGPGTTTSDSILARLSRGEYVHNAKAVKYYGPQMMNDINRMRYPKFASGGSPWYASNSSGGSGQQVNVQVTQMYPTTRDPIKTMKNDAEAVITGIWM